MTLSDRIATIADEAFGPFPVQDAETNLTEIERGIHIFHAEIERRGELLKEAINAANELVHYGDPKPWRIEEWKKAKDVAIRLCTSNPTGLRCAGLDAHKQDPVVLPPDSENQSERK